MIQQVILNSAEVSAIVAKHVAATLPPGTDANANVVFVGKHPKRKNTTQTYLRGNEDNRLAELTAVVTLTLPAPE